MSEQQQMAVRMTPAQKVAQRMRQDIPELATYLPSGVSVERFRAVMVSAILANRDLMNADRDSLWMAARDCARMGLLPDGKQAAIVTRWDKAKGKHIASCMPMTAGILHVLRSRGKVRTISANVAYAADTFRVVLGDAPQIEHEMAVTADRGEPIAVYAIAVLQSGDVEREVMTWKEVMAVRELASERSTAWRSFPTEMGKKTVIRRLAKRLPQIMEDEQVEAAVTAVDQEYDFDGRAERVRPEDLEPMPPEPEPEPERPEVPDWRQGAIAPEDLGEAAPPWEIISSSDGEVLAFPDGGSWLGAWTYRVQAMEGAHRPAAASVAKLEEVLAVNRVVLERLTELGEGGLVERVMVLIRDARRRLESGQNG